MKKSLLRSLRLKLAAALATVLAASALTAAAAPLSFDFKDPKGVNNILFRLDAPLEAISGSGNGVSGQVSFDPADPAATTGSISLATESLTVGNPVMKEHLHSAGWLGVAKFPEIRFEALSLSQVRTQGGKTEATVTGKLTVRDVTKEISVPITLTYLPGKLGARLGKPELKGDLLVLRSTFTINRSDYGIMAGKATDKVSEAVELTLSLAGAAARE
jgi:polyisoprenoid-binding protein YceI